MAALLDICLRTSDAGSDGRHLYSNSDYPGLIWALPYLQLCPQHAFVMEKGQNIAGSCVATTDTTVFKRRREHKWWPGLREMISSIIPSTTADQATFDYIRGPEKTPEWIATRYPAHPTSTFCLQHKGMAMVGAYLNIS